MGPRTMYQAFVGGVKRSRGYSLTSAGRIRKISGGRYRVKMAKQFKNMRLSCHVEPLDTSTVEVSVKICGVHRDRSRCDETCTWKDSLETIYRHRAIVSHVDETRAQLVIAIWETTPDGQMRGASSDFYACVYAFPKTKSG